MIFNAGKIITGGTVRLPFNTYNSAGASVTVSDLAAGDVKIHKNGNTTERASSAGVTVSIDFDAITGNHLISIDLSDNTDSGFYESGYTYQVRVEGITVDSQTINSFIGAFEIDSVVSLSVIPTAAQNRQEIDSNSTQLAAILADTGTDIPALIAAIQSFDPTAALEGSLTYDQAFRIMLAALAGKTTGSSTTTPKFRDQADSKNRISATLDTSGNRTAVSVDGS